MVIYVNQKHKSRAWQGNATTIQRDTTQKAVEHPINIRHMSMRGERFIFACIEGIDRHNKLTTNVRFRIDAALLINGSKSIYKKY
jgi:hypothetical protein